MLGPSELVAPLKFIATLVNEMKECSELCAHVHERMVVINDKLLVMEKKKTLPPDTAVHNYSSLVMNFSAFLTKHKGRSWVYRVVTSSRVMEEVKNYQERINTLMLTLNVIHIGAVASEREEQQRFRIEQERAITARLTDDAVVTKAVARVEQQIEALNVLMHELRKADGRSAATSATTMTLPADDNGLDTTAANQRLLTTALDKVVRRSSVQVRKVPVWFCSPQDVEYDDDAFAGGSFGTVHYGRMHDMDVVVKCLLVDTRGNANATKQFRDEASLWFSFRHRHVLLMYSACDVSSPPFIVCELAAHGNLRDFLSFEHNVPHTFRLLYEAALGLAYLHANRVVHGDLKGDNILVSADKSAKIADFSFSYVRAMSASRYSMAQGPMAGGSKRAGAIRWRAPECLKGRSPTLASDVYSFGMCILEVVSQAVPWGCRVDDDTVRFLAITGELPDRPTGIADRVWNLVTRMCSLDPDNRPSLASVTTELSELANDAERATGSVSVKADSVMSGVASMAISDRDMMASGVASMAISDRLETARAPASVVASHDTSSPVPTSTTLEQAITQDDVACATSMLSSTASICRTVSGWNAPPLVVAAATGATKVTEMLLARGADASARLTATSARLQDLHDTGITALHVAARAGHVSVVTLLLVAKPELVDILSAKHCSALHFAVRFGHIAVIEELLNHDARVEERDIDDLTPLYWTAIYNQVDSARVLLEHNANVHAKRSSSGTTTLHIAASRGHATLIDVLLHHGACVDEPDNDRDTPLYWSAIYGQADSARALLENNANVHAKRSKDGATALHRAVANGHVAVIEVLLRHGAHIEEPDNSGVKPLYWSAIHGQAGSARILLEHNANVHAKRRSDGTVALHQAASKGHVAVVEVLLRHGAHIDEPDTKRYTSLHHATMCGQVKSVHILLKHKANVHAKRSSNGATALHIAAAKGHVAVVEVLLRHGAHIEGSDIYGNTPLYWSAAHGQAGSARILLAHKANVQAKGSNGVTAFQQAVANGHVAVIAVLLRHGACVTRGDVKTAKKNGHAELVQLLKSNSRFRSLLV